MNRPTPTPTQPTIEPELSGENSFPGSPDSFERVRAFGEAANAMDKWDKYSMLEIGNVLNHYGLHGRRDMEAFEAGIAYFKQAIRNEEAERTRKLNAARAEAAKPKRADST